MFQAILPESHPMEREGTHVSGRSQDGGRGRSWPEDRPVGSVMQNRGTAAPERGEEYQESGAAQTKPPPPPQSSGGSSSVVSEATAENLSSCIDKLMSQQAQMVEATLWLVAAVSEGEGGTWEASPGMTARALTSWMDQQEDRVEELMERIERKRRELTRLAEVEEEDWVPSKTQSIREPAPSLNPGPDGIGPIEEICPSEGSPSGERESLGRPECDKYLFLTEYEYRILFGFQISPNTEYRILFGIEKIRIPNNEYYSVS